MGLTLLLIIIYIFVGIRITVACPAHIGKPATKMVSKEMPQIHVDTFHSKTDTLSQSGAVTEDRPLPLFPQKWNDP